MPKVEMTYKPERDIYNATRRMLTIYGTHANEDRAIPDIHDGLKPVQRMLLWSMYELGMWYSGGTKKSARIVGTCLGLYHPHGDDPVYKALVNMVHQNQPLVYGDGNFGSPITEDPPAAMRYTEAKLTKYAEKVLLSKEYMNVIPMTENFDGTTKVPVYLPAQLPNILLNGSLGIGLGISTSIPTFSTKSVKELVLEALSGKTITPELCASVLEFKFAGGGQVLSEPPEVLEYFKTGTGSIKLGAEIITDEDDLSMTVVSFPPNFRMEKKIPEIREDEKVRSAFDATDDEGPKLEIKFNNVVSAYTYNREVEQFYSKYLVESRSLRNNITVRSLDTTPDIPVVVVDFIEQANVSDIIKLWTEWRVQLEVDYLNYVLGELNKELKLQNLLMLAVNNLEKIFKVLKMKGVDLDQTLAKELKITVEEAKIILARQVRSLSALNGVEVQKKIDGLKKEIATTQAHLKKPAACVKAKLEKLEV